MRKLTSQLKLGSQPSPIEQLAALADLIGLDVLLAVMEVFSTVLDDPKYGLRRL